MKDSNKARVVITDLLNLLHYLGIKAADPMAAYGGTGARYTAVTQLLNANLISKEEAKRMLGWPGKEYL